MDLISIGFTTLLALVLWYIKYSYTKEQKRQEDDIQALKKDIAFIKDKMPTRAGVEKLSDDNRKGHVDIWEEVNRLREKLANLRGSMGKNGD